MGKPDHGIAAVSLVTVPGPGIPERKQWLDGRDRQSRHTWGTEARERRTELQTIK